MSPFRRGTTPAPAPSPSPPDDWAETRVEPAGAPDAWPETRVEPSRPTAVDADADAPTVLATRFLDDRDHPLSPSGDIGRATGADTRELFVSCDPIEALQQQFDHLQPEFIAVHDIGAAASRQVLGSVAAAVGTRVQRLVVRRQGVGTPLASLSFVDMPTAPGRTLRLYSTLAEADATLLPGLACTLLGWSRLGVVMIGAVPSATIVEALQPLREAMRAGAWQNRQLLLLPLAAAAAVAAHGTALGQATGVTVRTTPQVTRPAEAWQFITASWRGGGDLPSLPGSPASTAKSIPPSRTAATVEPQVGRFDRYLGPLADIAGWIGGCVFDIATGRVVAHAGAGPDAVELALHGRQMIATLGTASHALGLGRTLPDAAITLGAHHLLLRGLPGQPGLALLAVLDRHVANLALARLQVQRLDAVLAAPPG